MSVHAPRALTAWGEGVLCEKSRRHFATPCDGAAVAEASPVTACGASPFRAGGVGVRGDGPRARGPPSTHPPESRQNRANACTPEGARAGSRAMARFARKVRKRRSAELGASAEWLDALTRSSLRLTDAQWAEATSGEFNETSDIALARWLELMELLEVWDDGCDTLRAAVVERRGEEFFARVAAMRS